MIRKITQVYIKVRCFLLFCIIILFTGCGFLNFTENIQIRLPDLEYELLNGSGYEWILKFRGINGEMHSISISPDREKLILEVVKGHIQAFTIYAVIPGDLSKEFITKPAGFIYGFSPKKSGENFFTWSAGFESSILLDISVHVDLGRINIKRLLESISEVAGCENHWSLDGEAIREQLMSTEFKVYDIRKLRQRNIDLMIPAGLWFNSNLLGENIQSPSNVELITAEIPTGYSYYYNKEGFFLEIDMKSNGLYEYIVFE